MFVFFRGTVTLFDYDIVCNHQDLFARHDPHVVPQVFSDGDAHPENFGVMDMLNGKLLWGMNDFDEASVNAIVLLAFEREK